MKNKGLLFIFITLLIDIIGIGIIIPVIPDLIKSVTNADAQTIAIYGGWLTSSYALMQFLFAPILGSLSDSVGRRPVLLFALLGLGIDFLVQAFATTLGWLFVGRIIAGICGASITTASAYIADVSTPEKRAQNFGLIGAAFGIGFIIGPALGGYLGHFDIKLPFFVASGLSLLNFAFGYFILPESLAPENRRPFSLKSYNPFQFITYLKKYQNIAIIAFASFLTYIAGHALQSTWTYYTMFKFHWVQKDVGLSLAFVGIMVAIVQGGLIRILIPKIGAKNAIFLGLTINIAGMLAFALATKGFWLYVIMVPFALGGIAGPATQSIVSNQIPPNEQGQLQGSLTAIMSLTNIIGPLVMTNLFKYFSHDNILQVYQPGAPFIMGAILSAISLIILFIILNKTQHESN